LQIVRIQARAVIAHLAGRQIGTYTWQVHYKDGPVASKAISDLSVEYETVEGRPTSIGTC